MKKFLFLKKKNGIFGKMGQSTKNLAPKQNFQLLQKTMCQILPLMVRSIVIIGLLPMICTLSYRSLDHTITHRKGLSHFPEFIHKLIHNLSHEKVTPLTELTFFVIQFKNFCFGYSYVVQLL